MESAAVGRKLIFDENPRKIQIKMVLRFVSPSKNILNISTARMDPKINTGISVPNPGCI